MFTIDKGITTTDRGYHELYIGRECEMLDESE